MRIKWSDFYMICGIIFLTCIVALISIPLYYEFLKEDETPAQIGYRLAEGNITSLPQSNVSFFVTEQIVNRNGAYAVYNIQNNSGFWMPVEIWTFYNGTDRYMNSSIRLPYPLYVNDRFSLQSGLNETMTNEELSNLKEVHQYLIVENLTGSKFRISSILYKDMDGLPSA